MRPSIGSANVILKILLRNFKQLGWHSATMAALVVNGSRFRGGCHRSDFMVTSQMVVQKKCRVNGLRKRRRPRSPSSYWFLSDAYQSLGGLIPHRRLVCIPKTGSDQLDRGLINGAEGSLEAGPWSIEHIPSNIHTNNLSSVTIPNNPRHRLKRTWCRGLLLL